MYFIISLIYILHWYQIFLKFGAPYNFCLLSRAPQDKATKQLCGAVTSCVAKKVKVKLQLKYKMARLLLEKFTPHQ